MVDIHQQGEHRITLGDSLKHGALQHVSVKYNWMPKDGFSQNSGTIKGAKDDLKLSYQYDDSKYVYTGWLSEQPEDTPQLALFYDKQQSAYVLEKLAASLNMNIKSGTNLSSDYIKRHAQLPRSHSNSGVNGNRNDSDGLFDDGEDELPDPSNPFDYRNFLKEAKEAAEKQSGRTPLPGGRTPMSGFSSPLAAGGHSFSTTTPQFGPMEIKSSSQVTKEENSNRRRRKAATTTKSPASRKAQPTSRPKTAAHMKHPQPLSQEKVLDSDSDDDASADMSDRPSPATAPAKKPMTTHHRNVSSTSFASATQSPRIVVDDGGLEIDTGSPPHGARQRSYRIDPEAFRSQTGTPHLGRTTHRSDFDHRSTSRYANPEVEMRDAEIEEDEAMKYLQDDDSDPGNDNNGDVDELILDDRGAKSPTPPLSPPIEAPKPKRRRSSAVKSRRPKAPSPPPLQQSNSMEDDDGGLAAELEAALEREQQEQEMRMQGVVEEEGGVGLGIGTGGGQDDEEDISEEE